MWPVLIFADTPEHCRAVSDIVGTVDRRICIECTTDINSLDGLVRCRNPVLALVSAADTRLALRAVGALRRHGPELPIVTEVAANVPLESLQALAFGATEYLKRPVAPWEWQQRSRMLLERQRQKRVLQLALQRDARQRGHGTADTPPHLAQLLGHIDMLHDHVTGSHDRRTGHIAGLIARTLGLPAESCHHIAIGAAMHDLGKIGIPDRILHKPGRYDADDHQVMRAHPRIGYEILRNDASAPFQVGAEIALTHHERFDGSGYPSGLSGESIPLAGRITAVADVFDAITDHRLYRRSLTPEQGLRYLRRCSGTLFDPDCVDALQARTAEATRIKTEL